MTVDFLPWQQPAIVHHTQRLLKSFQHWTGCALLGSSDEPDAIAQQLFEAPFVVLSHGIEADPIYNYGNQAALDLWEMDWHQFTQMPSRLSAEPIEQIERDRILQQAKQQGYISDYQGVRISNSGKRFRIENVIVWDVLDEAEQRCGQAATFNHWDML